MMTTIAGPLSEINLPVYAGSQVEDGEVAYFLSRPPGGKQLGVLAPVDNAALQSFSGEAVAFGAKTLLLCPLTHRNTRPRCERRCPG